MAALGLLVPIAVLLSSLDLLTQAQVKFVAFSANRREYGPAGSGRVLAAETHHYFRSDGSHLMERREFIGTNHRPLTTVMLSLPDGVSVHSISELKIVSRLYRFRGTTAAVAARRLDPATGCLNSYSASAQPEGVATVLGDDRVQGFSTKVIARQVAAGHRVIFHYAQDLDCFPLLERHELSNDNETLAAVMDTVTVNVVLGEPTKSFEVPADYRRWRRRTTGPAWMPTSNRRRLRRRGTNAGFGGRGLTGKPRPSAVVETS